MALKSTVGRLAARSNLSTEGPPGDAAIVGLPADVEANTAAPPFSNLRRLTLIVHTSIRADLAVVSLPAIQRVDNPADPGLPYIFDPYKLPRRRMIHDRKIMKRGQAGLPVPETELNEMAWADSRSVKSY
jgi:hypothetical protein